MDGHDATTEFGARLTRPFWDKMRFYARREGKRRGLDPDEAESVAGLAVAEALRTWRPDRGAKFETWAGHLVNCRLLDAWRLQHGPRCSLRRGGGVSVVGFADLDGASDASELVEADEEPVGWEIEYEEWVRGLARHRGLAGEALATLYLDAAHSTMRLAGRRIGRSESRVSQMVALALAEIRAEEEAKAC